MVELIDICRDYILNKLIFWNNITYLKRITSTLNNENIIIISWLKNVWKTSIIKELLIKSWSNDNFFYFNKDLDTTNKIKDTDNLVNLINTYINIYSKPKLIIFHNINKLNWIKEFLFNFKENKIPNLRNYKIIIIWNNNFVENIKEIEILPKNITKNQILDIDNTLKYWLLNEVNAINHNSLKERLLCLIKNDILLKDIYNNNNVKSIDLYNYTISFLAKNNNFYSIKELNKDLNQFIDIPLKTNIDYIELSISSKIIKRSYKYDIKTETSTSSQVKYYFTDLWIRNTLNNYKCNKQDLIENLIFNELNKKWYKIYSWINWFFEFTFLWIIPALVPFMKWKELKIYIHISYAKYKNQAIKEMKKLDKIWNNFKKYLLLDNYKELWISDPNLNSVEIMTIKKFLNSI